MGAQIIPLMQRRLRPAFPRDWTPQELAEFYRVESALVQAGLELESERGVSDEGDPWFVFCRADTGEVFIHFARVDGDYVVDGAAFPVAARGRDFGALVRDLVARHPLANVRRPGSNVLIHPAALLIALVGAAFFHSGKAKAAEPAHHDANADARPENGRRALVVDLGAGGPAAGAEGARAIALDAGEVAAVLAGVAIGLRQVVAAPVTDTAPAASALPASVLSVSSGPIGSARSSADAALADASFLGAAEVRAALVVMATFRDLALPVTAAASPAAHGTDLAPALPSAAPLAAPVLTTLAAPVLSAPADASTILWVHLVGGPLPEIMALSVVIADGALAKVGVDHVVHVDQLPQFLADLISHGEVISADSGTGGAGAVPSGGGADGGGGAASPSVDGPFTINHAADGTSHTVGGAAAGPTQSGAGASSGHGDAPPVTSAPADPTPASPAPASPPAQPVTVSAGHSAAQVAAMNAAILAFVDHVANVQTVVSGHEVVFYDPQILMGLLPTGETLDSITFRFDDGSSVSLVGTATELHGLHGLG